MDGELRNMVLAFRVTELQCLLGFAGKNKTGRKNELQARALELVKNSKHGHIITKIKELYKSIQASINQQNISNIPASSGMSHLSSSAGFYIPPHMTSSSSYAGAQEKALQGRNPYSSINNNVTKTNMALISMPICPDVKIKKLPFFEIVSELIKPTSLISNAPVRMQEGNFPFCLTPQQAADVAASKELLGGSLYSSDQKIGYQMQVQLRFVLLDTNGEQEDNFPPSICVRVNGKIVPLPSPIPSNRPAVEPKRPSRPLNITNYVKLSPTCTNTVGITWVSDGLGRGWVMSLFLVKKLSATDLLSRLKNRGARPAEFTKGMVKEIVLKDDGDCQIAMTSLTVSVACPLGKCRMALPCRASTCKHLQCFDASLFLQMNEKKPTWTCPVCDKPIAVENLSIDGYFQEIINSLSFDSGNDIEVFPDGSWKALSIKKEHEDVGPPSKRARTDTRVNFNSTICLDDDLIIEDSPVTSQNVASSTTTSNSNGNKTANKVVDVVDLTLSDSDSSEDFRPLIHRRRPTVKAIQEESSSSSDSDCSESSASSEEPPKKLIAASSKPGPAKVLRSARSTSSSSPTVITLDSPSPEPQPQENHRTSRENLSSSYTASTSNSSNMGATASGSNSAGTTNAAASSSSNNNTAPAGSRRIPSPSLLTSHNFNQNELGTYDNFDRWDDVVGSFPNTDAFATLDFGALEFLDYQAPNGGFNHNW